MVRGFCRSQLITISIIEQKAENPQCACHIHNDVQAYIYDYLFDMFA